MSLKKAKVLMRRLKERLEFRLPDTYLFTDSFDANGNPVLTIAQDSSWATGEQYAVIRIKPIEHPFTNVLGQAQESFGPHLSQLCSEDDGASKSELSDENMQKILLEMVKEATIVEIYRSANGDVPAVGELVAGNLQLTLDDLIHPLTSSM